MLLRWMMLVGGLLVGTGCATVEAATTANGQPLSAKTHIDHVPTEIDSRDNIVLAHDRLVFDAHLQGPTVIDELDYFTIAGDADAVAEIVAFREKVNFATAVGSPFAFLGAAAFAGAGATWLLSEDRDSVSFTDTPAGQLTVGLSLGGFVLMTGGLAGYYLLLPSPRHPEPTDFVMPYARAVDAAEAYNATLSAPPTP